MADEKDEEEEVDDSSDEANEEESEIDVSESESSSDDSESDGDDSEASEDESSDDGGPSSDLVEKMAESDQLEGVSKDAIKDALSEVADDADDESLTDAVDSVTGDDEGDGDEDDGADVEVEETASDEEDVDEGGADEEDVGDASDDEEDETDTSEDEASDEASDEADSDTEQVEDESSEPAPHALGDVFEPELNRSGEADSRIADEAGFDPIDDQESNSGVLIVGVGAVVAAAIGIGVLFGFTEQGERLAHLFTGDLKEWELAESRRQAAKLREKQRQVIADTPKIGTLKMRGTPRYGLVKVDGEVQYGKFQFEGEQTDYWKRMRLGPRTNFPVFNIEDKHKVTVESPGYLQRTLTLEKGNWTPIQDSVPDLDDAALKYTNQVNVILVPESRAREIELHKRSLKNEENEFFGTVSIETKPEGAKITFNGEPLRNKEGEELTTPVTFKKFYTEKDEEEKEDGDSESSDESEGKWKENKVKVDMPPDNGHAIRLKVPDSKGDYPKFATQVNRTMWKCEWKDGEVPDNPHPKHCNYSFDLSVDFNKMKSSIDKRKSTRGKIKQAWEDAQKKLDEIVESATEANVKGASDKKKKSKDKGEGEKKGGEEGSE